MSAGRNIPERTKMKLIAMFGGRCVLCNKDLTDSFLNTNTDKLFYEVAHNNAFNKNGPRFDENQTDKNQIDNLMPLCYDCHKCIDDDPDSYPADELRKRREQKIKDVATALDMINGKRYTLLLCSAPVASNSAPMDIHSLNECLFRSGVLSRPEGRITVMDNYSRSENPDALMCELKSNLNAVSDRWAAGAVDPYCIFGFGPMYLLMALGHRLAQHQGEVLTAIRLRSRWVIDKESKAAVTFGISSPETMNVENTVVLEVNVTVPSDSQQVSEFFGENVDLWSVFSDVQRPDVITNQAELNEFGRTVTRVLDQISRVYGTDVCVHVVPRMCNALCITFGMYAYSKSSPNIVVHDFRKDEGRRVITDGVCLD